jgi:uncharacterized protein YkwD
MIARRCLALGLVSCLAITANAAYPPATSYGVSAGATPRSELEKRIEALVADVAIHDRRSAPRAEPRLERVATALAELDDPSPSNDLVEAALSLYGIVEPPPQLIVATASVGADKELQEPLRAQIEHALTSGRYARQGAAVVTHGDQLRVVVAMQESFLELAPMARAMPSGGSAQLHGRLLGPFEHPSAFVTPPDGRTITVALAGDAKRFSGAFACGPARGAYQVEVTGEDRFGSTVLANFPIYCGVSAPTLLEAPRLRPEAPVADAASAESRIFQLVNEDRKKAGLPPLTPDARLAEVARAHCRDMLEHGFVGHVSPTTGDAAKRVEHAKIRAALVLENVARASTPGEVERGLMASPGHRRNILSSEAKRLGVGVVLSEAVGGARELLVTQLFLEEEAPFRAATPEELRARLVEQRRARGLSPFVPDPVLDRIADGVARDLASGRATPQSVRPALDRSLGTVAARYKDARSLFAVATQISQVVESMKEPLAASPGPVALGIGIATGPSGDHLAHHAVLIVATPR